MENFKKTMKAHLALIALTKEDISRLPVEEEEEEGGGSGGSGGGKTRKKSRSSAALEGTEEDQESGARAHRSVLRERRGECPWRVVERGDQASASSRALLRPWLSVIREIDEADLLGSLEEPSDHTFIEHIEYSSVKEVMDWLRACKDGE